MPASSTSACRVGALILAAGKGTRMYSDKPKVLQRILEQPMLGYVYAATLPVCDTLFTVIGHGADMVREAFPDRNFIVQSEQLGTGHALQTAWSTIIGAKLDYVLVINGDTPLLREEALGSFLQASLDAKADLAFITLTLDSPGAFGRVVRKAGAVTAIVEAKDYDSATHGPETGEINAGIYCLRVEALTPLLPLLHNNNKSGEYYITDFVGLAVERSLSVYGHNMGNDPNLLGINSPAELVRSEELLRAGIVRDFLDNGVIIRQPDSVRIGPDVLIEKGVEIFGPCELYGNCRIAVGTRIESHCWMRDTSVASGVMVRSYCHCEDAVVGERCIVGPYARLRPGAVLEEKAHVGNFVEMKKARLGKGAKANHLTYLGDAEIGAGANIGAGTITCNYDGINKHTTLIGDNAFIGSNSSLVAPVEIGEGALVGAGSVITKSVPDKNLGITRAPQRMLPLKLRS
ncbi:bifunctional UDP-N-acetylglucosamine diphosphorylase/glucosamine-1-phosphate N-acetyltransferase GlmU [Desulfovibrio sp. OttesenSCG-928-G15]|nr:bifunctional UDP-N-acetylglucosamine diphosphorylase/glucosamine-1-phosphate N-acetyltransferase GlmU [Desulfovibrio sp. OttesenSCG-928-G15]